MNIPLRILHLEDDMDYSDLVRSLLEAEGIPTEMVVVSSREEFESALEHEVIDIILADFLLPAYNGLEALGLAREKRPEVPFLLVSGTIAEQTAIESLKSGATDYVLKHCPERLVPAVRRAISEAAERCERRRVEGEMARRDEHFRTLTENLLDILVVLNADATIQYNSPSIQRVLGYTGSLAGTDVFTFVHEEDLPAVKAAFEEVLAQMDGLTKLELRARHADGSWRYLEAIAQNRLIDPQIAGIVVSARDVTDRKQAEQGLRESEQQYRLIFDGNPLPMWVFDHETLAILEVNDAAVQCYGYTRDEFLRMNLKDIRVSDETPALLEYLHRLCPAAAEGKMGFVGLWQHRRRDGAIIDVEIKWTPLLFKGRAASLAMANDVTERKRNEQALKQSELLFHSVWENSLDGMRLTNAEGVIVAVNTAFCRMVGLERSQLEGQPFTIVYAHGQNHEDLLRAYGEEFRRRATQTAVEHRLLLHNGGIITVEERTSFVELSGQGTLLLASLRDVTAQKRLEDQFRQAQKMEAIGQLAGGVAHDFNNILTVIHGHGSMLQSNPELPSSSARSAQQIVQSAERAAGLTRQLLTFSRRQVMQTRRLDLNEVVGNMTKMLGRILGEDIALQLSYSSRHAFVEADAGMIEQVLLNLAVNSRDAMPKGGVLSIQICLRDITEHDLYLDPEALVGRFVCLTVSDSGCGIPKENQRRIFEPFFTTKEVGKGTGLGLATVYGIVKQHQGWIHVESEPDKGATFRVFLPRVLDPQPSRSEQPSQIQIKGGSETILVVEDEQPVRELVCHLLTGHGYTILEADSALQALELWREQQAQIDLLLTDLVMPDRMNGRELAERLWTDRPDLKVVFTSGYSTDVVGRDFTPRPGLQYLQKPYHPHKLAVVVRDCLDGAAAN